MKRIFLFAIITTIIFGLLAPVTAFATSWMTPEKAKELAKKKDKWIVVFVTKGDDVDHNKFAKMNIETGGFMGTLERAGFIPVKIDESKDKNSKNFGTAPAILFYDSDNKLLANIDALRAYITLISADKKAKETHFVVNIAPRMNMEALLIIEMFKMDLMFKQAEKSKRYDTIIRQLNLMVKEDTYKKYQPKATTQKDITSSEMDAMQTNVAMKAICQTYANNMLGKIKGIANNLLDEGDKALESQDYKKALSIYFSVSSGFASIPEIAKSARDKANAVRKDPGYLESLRKTSKPAEDKPEDKPEDNEEEAK